MITNLDVSGEPVIKLYVPWDFDYNEFWIKDVYGNLHQKEDGSVWVRYAEYEDGLVYVPEEDLPESERLPKIIS